jgi:CBS domain-containing protein
MTEPGRAAIVIVGKGAWVREACQSMRDRRDGAVLVTEADRRLAGIFTGGDAVHRVLAARVKRG